MMFAGSFKATVHLQTSPVGRMTKELGFEA
jgi:hypothetical protein